MKLRCILCQLLAAAIAFLMSFSAHAETPRITLDIDETRTLDFASGINGASAARFIAELHRLDNGKPILIRITSPGGDIIAGIDMIKAVQDAKSPITCAVDRYAASMAAFLAVACPNLIMHKYGILMFHEYSADIGGSRKDIKSRLDFVESIFDALVSEMSLKTGIPKAELEAKLAKDWWLNAKEADEAHFISATIDHYHIIKRRGIIDWFLRPITEDGLM